MFLRGLRLREVLDNYQNQFVEYSLLLRFSNLNLARGQSNIFQTGHHLSRFFKMANSHYGIFMSYIYDIMAYSKLEIFLKNFLWHKFVRVLKLPGHPERVQEVGQYWTIQISLNISGLHQWGDCYIEHQCLHQSQSRNHRVQTRPLLDLPLVHVAPFRFSILVQNWKNIKDNFRRNSGLVLSYFRYLPEWNTVVNITWCSWLFIFSATHPNSFIICNSTTRIHSLVFIQLVIRIVQYLPPQFDCCLIRIAGCSCNWLVSQLINTVDQFTGYMSA